MSDTTDSFLDMEQVSFNIILHAGNARADIFSALEEAKSGKWDVSEDLITKAKDELKQAHDAQTKLLQGFAGGVKIIPDLLLVHAQDHLMTAKSEFTLVEELIYLYRKQKVN